MKDKKNKFNKLTPVFIVLAIVAAFLLGRIWGKRESGEKIKITSQPTAAPQPTQVPFAPQKTAKPEVKFFVMSFCPYGNQAEDGLEPVYQLLKEKVDWQPRYIVDDQKISCEQNCPYRVFNADAEKRCNSAISQGQVKDMETCKTYFPYKSTEECLEKTCVSIKPGQYQSLHGDQELHQDIREICAFKEGNLAKWWKFVSLVNKNCNYQNADTCWKTYASQAGFSTSKITACENTKTEELLKAELAESAKYGASGSPTIFINGVLYNEGRSPESFKKAICASFETAPAECQKILGQEETAPAGGCN